VHEEALLRDLRRRIVELAEVERIDRVTGVTLWVGALAHASEASLRARWPMTVAGTPAEGSRLDVEISDDVHDARAEGIVLARVDVSDRSEVPDAGPAPTRASQEGPGRAR
jgi:hydrogenase nickel incorporation protein HypA/HybF